MSKSSQSGTHRKQRTTEAAALSTEQAQGGLYVQPPKARKPRKKPHQDFPLGKHKTRGYWCKKVLRKVHYFGKIADDPDGKAALELWLEQKDDLLAGRVPRKKRGDGITVSELATQFLLNKQRLLASGEITDRTYKEYFATGERLVKEFGRDRPVSDLHPEDFGKLRESIAKKWGPQRLANEITRVRSVFLFGFSAKFLPAPVSFGPMFNPPSKKTLRRNRAAKGLMLFEAEQIHRLFNLAGPQLRAMMLLGLNCGFGNGDCGTLPIRSADLARGWINFPRPKTGIERRCPLWPETVAALEVALKDRPTPKDETHSGLLFITKYGGSWFKQDRDNPVSKEFKKLLKAADKQAADEAKKAGHKPPEKIERHGLGFYSLRHTFATIAGGSRDQVAVNAIMGHVDESMAAMYRERVDDERLQTVVNHVHAWLFGKPESKSADNAGGKTAGKASAAKRSSSRKPTGKSGKRGEPAAAGSATGFVFRIVG